MQLYKSTPIGKILMPEEETKQFIIERELHKKALKARTLEERIIDLEQRVAKLEK